MSFNQFKNFLENLWLIKANIEMERCKRRMARNMKIFETVFNFLDVDQSGSLDRPEMEKGIQTLLKDTVPAINYDNIFNNDNYAKGGKLVFPQFITVIARNKLLENTNIPYKNLAEKLTKK